MKIFTVSLLLTLIAGSGVLYLRKAGQVKRAQARAAEAEATLRETEAHSLRRDQQNEVLRERLRETESQATSKDSELHELKKQLNGPTNTIKAAEGSPGAKLFKDPEMRAMMKKQQMDNVEQMVKKIVNADLIKQFALAPEQAGYLKELLKKKYGPGSDIMIELMAGELSDAQMGQLGKQFKQQMAEADAGIKTFLGEEAYKSFEWQEKSQEERSRVKEFEKRTAEVGQALTPEQGEALLRIMYQERQNHKFQVDYNDPSNYDYEHLQEFFGEDNLNLFFQDLEQVNEKILQSAQAILTPEQSAEFKSLQQEQLEKGKTVVRMTNALFGKRKAN